MSKVIEGKLLAALDDGEHVAVVLSRQDIDALIDALEPGPALTIRQMEMLNDLKRLRASAF